MEMTNKSLVVLLAISVFVVGGFLYFADGVTGLATAEVESGFDYWPLIAGMTGVLGIGVIVVAAHARQQESKRE